MALKGSFCRGAVLVLAFIFFNLQCSSKSSPSEEEGILLTLAYLASLESPSQYDCSGNWRFAKMLESGVGVTCTKCHNEELRVNQFVITDYKMVRDRVKPRNPEDSLLYLKITEGTMRFYANEEIRRGVYCWIRQGARN